MTDDELIEKLKATAGPPPHADDPGFWAAFEADLARKLDAPRPRRRLGIWVGAASLAAAAALAVLVHVGRPHRSVATVGGAAAAEDELLPSEDPTELVGDLDLDELHTVDQHFHGG